MLTSVSRVSVVLAVMATWWHAGSLWACEGRGFGALASAAAARSLVNHTSAFERALDREAALERRTRSSSAPDEAPPMELHYGYMWVDEDFYGLRACAREGAREAVLDRSWFGFMAKSAFPDPGYGYTLFYLDADDDLRVLRPDGVDSALHVDQYIFGLRTWWTDVVGLTFAWHKHQALEIVDRDRGLRLPGALDRGDAWSFYTNVTVPSLALSVDVAGAELRGVDLARLSSETIALPWGELTLGAYVSYVRRLDRGVAALELGNIVGVFDIQLGGELVPVAGTFARLRADHTWMFREFHDQGAPHWRIMLRPYAEGSVVGGQAAALAERGSVLWGAQFGLGVHVIGNHLTIGLELEGGLNRVDDLLFVPELAHSWRLGSRLICRLGI